MALCKATEGCSKEGKKLGFCGTHYTQVQRGARDVAGHLLRDLRATYVGAGTLCKAPECRRVPFARGFCTRHHQLFRFNRIDEQGAATDPSTWRVYTNPNRKPSVSTTPCKIAECSRMSVSKETQLCGTHYQQLARGIIDVDGRVLREFYRKRRYEEHDLCKIEGCGQRARSNFFCRTHAGQFDGGRIDETGKVLRLPAVGRAARGQSRYVTPLGYVLVSAPSGHPFARKDNLIFEHRFVMEQQLGRYLEPHEVVHHKDGNRENNAPSNLEVLTRKRHPTAHEYTVETTEAALEALQHNDPKAYEQLLSRITKKNP